VAKHFTEARCSLVLNIHSAMLIILGFLIANLLVLLLAPAYWRRAVRLTTARIKKSMPLTEAEIAADKDRMRAEYAIKVHRLESKAEQAALDAAHQQIELNRRDAAISALEGEVGRHKASLEEHENARRVLEQTITDRVPRLEHLLAETKKALALRERELTGLRETAAKQAKSLEESAHVNAHQRDEVMRLNSSFAAMSSRTRQGIADPRFDAEVALRTELATLRAKLSEQTAQFESLRGAAAGSGSGGQGRSDQGLAAVGEIRTSADLDEALALARKEAEAALDAKTASEEELRKARNTIEDHALEIARLKASLEAYERGSSDERSLSLKDNRIAMKARIGELQAKSTRQSTTINRMRGELAAANEKLAKQAAHFMSEMRRIGANGGAIPAAKLAGEARKTEAQPADRRARLAKIVQAAKPLAAGAAPMIARVRQASTPSETNGEDASRVKGFLKALGGAAAVRGGGRDVAGESVAGEPDAEVPPTEGRSADKSEGRRLVDRIVSATKS